MNIEENKLYMKFPELREGILGPSHSRLWIFPLEGRVIEEKRELLLSKLREFAGGWNAHKKAVTGCAELFAEKFVMMAADESVTGVSGCSTDSMVRAVQLAVESLGMKLADVSLIFYCPDGEETVTTVSRAEFKRLASQGAVTLDTLVFDPVVSTAGDVYEGKFLKPVRDSWHARLLGAVA